MPEVLLEKPRYWLEQKETVTHLGCVVRSGFTATGQEGGRFVGVVEWVTLEGPSAQSSEDRRESY